MPDDRHIQSVSGAGESEIDRELTRLLSIATSPDFAAGVRQRIHAQPARRPWISTWWIGLAAAAALVVIAIAASRPWRTEGAPREARNAVDTVLPAASTTPRALPVPVSSSQVNVRRVSPPRVASAATARKDAAPAQPEVLVSRDQLRAIARLRELMVSGELSEEKLPPVGGAPPAISEIELPALTIAPLTVPAVEAVGSRPER